MRYFIMKQNTRLPDSLKIRPPQTEYVMPGARASNIYYLDGDGEESRPDFIEKPVMMVSAELKQIIGLYEDAVVFENAVLIHRENKFQFEYCQVDFPVIEALSGNTEYYPNRVMKRAVLSWEKIREYPIFIAEDCRVRHLFVSLSVAESLLRRKAKGILFEEVEVCDE